MKRSMLFAVVLGAVMPFVAFAQTADDLKNDENTPGDVLVYGMGYSANRFSPLTQINKDNVSKLVPVWAYSLADLQGGESFPVVKDGVIYATTHNATAAVDALTASRYGGSFTTTRLKACVLSAAVSSTAASLSTKAW